MKFRIFCMLACVASLPLTLSTQAFSSEVASQPNISSANLTSQAKAQLSLNQLRDRGRAITVKVLAGQGWGSGILIKKQGQVYTVITNAHVLRIGKSYQIQTADGKIYTAQAIKSAQFPDDDLGLLSFKSANNYAIAAIATSSLAIGDQTFAIGYPDEQQGLVFNTGKVEYLLPQAFRGGYQVGYSNDIFKGMSGGPLLNRRGELVGVNGKHKYPLWGNTYIFKDGSTPVLQVRRKFDASSWAVPIQRFLQLAPQFATGAILPTQEQSSFIVPEFSHSPSSPEESPNFPIPATNQTSGSSFW
ncbi:serine protease [Desmonostoc muscorum LEGE 12446]|uniref:Trypsin-like peptidase domain-containing protein n=1 Tax=Desmonostoc muscorum LEGE 12446 TaxID=1828758 RepID=A0A8J7DED6_DESMC|nr:serine protease [Desmonostoc muscorum]MCF2146300.1 serine protease [Desmonostoc muscorum LEGE 12446]